MGGQLQFETKTNSYFFGLWETQELLVKKDNKVIDTLSVYQAESWFGKALASVGYTMKVQGGTGEFYISKSKYNNYLLPEIMLLQRSDDNFTDPKVFEKMIEDVKNFNVKGENITYVLANDVKNINNIVTPKKSESEKSTPTQESIKNYTTDYLEKIKNDDNPERIILTLIKNKDFQSEIKEGWNEKKIDYLDEYNTVNLRGFLDIGHSVLFRNLPEEQKEIVRQTAILLLGEGEILDAVINTDKDNIFNYKKIGDKILNKISIKEAGDSVKNYIEHLEKKPDQESLLIRSLITSEKFNSQVREEWMRREPGYIEFLAQSESEDFRPSALSIESENLAYYFTEENQELYHQCSLESKERIRRTAILLAKPSDIKQGEIVAIVANAVRNDIDEYKKIAERILHPELELIS